MDQELFELCKEVYERTGWKETYKWWMPEVTTNVSKIDTGQIMVTDNYLPVYQPEGSKIGYPLYTSDYLLEKLKSNKGLWVALEYQGSFGWNATAYNHAKTADTPLKALLKLSIALHEAGELK